LAQQQQQQVLAGTSSHVSSKALVSTDVNLPREALRIVWPTVDLVRNSIEGWSAGEIEIDRAQCRALIRV
jgi:hypothetical protein